MKQISLKHGFRSTDWSGLIRNLAKYTERKLLAFEKKLSKKKG